MNNTNAAQLLDIIIPVFNEDEIILQTLDEIKDKITISYRILIIYDFEEDTTVPVVKKYVSRNEEEVLLIKNKYGRGVLNAIKTGFEEAEGEAILVVMGDASDDLSVVPEMYEKLKNGADIVCGSRYMKGGRQAGGPLLKKFLSYMAGISLHYITGIPTHDITNNFKMYRRSLIDTITIESQGGFEIGLEILVKAFLKNKNITEVPSIWRERTAGKSNFKLWKWLPYYLRWYLLALKKRRFKI